MGMFDQMKAAGGMLKGMDPGQIKDLMSQAKESQKMMNDHIDKAVAKIIKEKDLVSRDEIKKMIEESK